MPIRKIKRKTPPKRDKFLQRYFREVRAKQERAKKHIKKTRAQEKFLMEVLKINNGEK